MRDARVETSGLLRLALDVMGAFLIAAFAAAALSGCHSLTAPPIDAYICLMFVVAVACLGFAWKAGPTPPRGRAT